jgi:hypothetical protein
MTTPTTTLHLTDSNSTIYSSVNIQNCSQIKLGQPFSLIFFFLSPVIGIKPPTSTDPNLTDQPLPPKKKREN